MINKAINRSEFIKRFALKHKLSPIVAAKIFKSVVETITLSLSQGKRVEIRGFGSFEIRQRKARQARNPKTGQIIHTQDKRSIYFRPGKEMRERVNAKAQGLHKVTLY